MKLILKLKTLVLLILPGFLPGSITYSKNSSVTDFTSDPSTSIAPVLSNISTDFVENTIEITDDKKVIQASYEDGAQKFGGGMKLMQDDPVWGNYFELSGSYVAKEPNYKELSSKLILGKTKNESKNYW